MKMTIVIDSEDTKGIQAALAMTRLMHDKYVGTTTASHKESFGKIEFIKMLKDFNAFCALPDTERNPEGHLQGAGKVKLRSLKQFADHVWTEKKNNSYYHPKWLKR